MSNIVDDLQFYSGYPIDKITVQDTVSYSLVGSGSITPATQLNTISNPYGKKCLTTVSWSVDGTNYYDQDDIIHGTGTSGSTLSVGSSDSSIYFYLGNSTSSTFTFTINYTLYSIS